MQQLVLKSQDLTSPVQSFSRYLDQDLISMDLEEGITGVNQLLSQIGVELNIDQGDCIVADEEVGGELLCPPGYNSLILTDEGAHRPSPKGKDLMTKQTPQSLNFD